MFGHKEPEDFSMADSTQNTRGSAYFEEVLAKFTSLDFTSDIDENRLGELSSIAPILRNFKDSFCEVLLEVKINSMLISKASDELNKTSRTMRDQVIHISEFAANVSHSTSEMNANLSTVSAATEELSINMSSISDAASVSRDHINMISESTHQLTDAAREIAVSTDRATQVSNRAQQQVSDTSSKVALLEAAAKEIDVVTATISEISDQTKLLALNATIEAARAGEAGKGFAVVAKEVKDLALQTSQATRNIQEKIAIIQNATREATKAMTGISDVINEVNDVVTTIAAASEEQSVTTQNIAQSILDTTNRIDDMTTNVEQGAQAVQDVNMSISDSAKLARSVADSLLEVDRESSQTMTDAVRSYALALEVTSHNSEMARTASLFNLPREYEDRTRNIPSELCRFTKTFDVSVDQYNRDHLRIFEYINEIHSHVKSGSNNAVILPVLKSFSTFTTEHFAREEEVFIKTNYAAYPGHREIHEKLLGEVRDVIRKLESNEYVDLIEVMVFLKKWLIDHIYAVDKKYGPWLNECGIH